MVGIAAFVPLLYDEMVYIFASGRQVILHVPNNLVEKIYDSSNKERDIIRIGGQDLYLAFLDKYFSIIIR